MHCHSLSSGIGIAIAVGLGLVVVLAQQVQPTTAAGYHYERPAGSVVPFSESGHYFAPLPTVAPLPPVPALPPLPTGRPHTHSHQSLVQVHPTPQPIVVDYSPPARTYSAPQQRVQQQQQQQQQPQQQSQSPARSKTIAQLYSPPAAAGYNYNVPTKSNTNYYVANGRQLKQYAVIEVIDNDIEPTPQPYLTPFFDAFRASVGASGTGAIPNDEIGISSRQFSLDDNLLRAQQAVLQQQLPSRAVALGSGGLGYIQLPNGQIYLGSGSLGYVSTEQRLQLAKEARTRSGAPTPDALHFGHGPLGGMSNFPFK